MAQQPSLLVIQVDKSQRRTRPTELAPQARFDWFDGRVQIDVLDDGLSATQSVEING